MDFQPVDRLVVRGAVRVEAGDGVDLGGDRVPVQSGELAGLGPVARVVVEDGSFAVPGHLADREHGLDVCGHEGFPFEVGKIVAVLRLSAGSRRWRSLASRESPSAAVRPAG